MFCSLSKVQQTTRFMLLLYFNLYNVPLRYAMLTKNAIKIRSIEEVLIKLTNLQENKQDIRVLQVRLIRGQRTDLRSQLGEPPHK